jgi:hypothetical protein
MIHTLRNFQATSVVAFRVAIRKILVETIRSHDDPDARCSAEERTFLLRFTLGDFVPPAQI